jgi:hypothetical protein
VLSLFIGGCTGEKAAESAARVEAVDSAPAPQANRPPVASVEQLIDPRVPRAVAGQQGWQYQQRVSADLDVDGTMEVAVLISDVGLDARGLPMWEHGHRWQVYVQEPDGTRTYLYARFLPNGKLTAELTQPQSTNAPTISLIEQSPTSLALYEIAYNGVGKAEIGMRFERSLQSRTFVGSPRP